MYIVQCTLQRQEYLYRRQLLNNSTVNTTYTYYYNNYYLLLLLQHTTITTTITTTIIFTTPTSENEAQTCREKVELRPLRILYKQNIDYLGGKRDMHRPRDS